MNSTAFAAEGPRWRVYGPDRTGDPLTVVVALEADVVVITAF